MDAETAGAAMIQINARNAGMSETEANLGRWILNKTVTVASVWLATAGLAPPCFSADAINGERLAQQWCTSCHVVPGVAGGPVLQGPPSFRAIAHDSKTRNQLAAFLEQPHGSMPPLSLSRAEIADVLAYIDTLR